MYTLPIYCTRTACTIHNKFRIYIYSILSYVNALCVKLIFPVFSYLVRIIFMVIVVATVIVEMICPRCMSIIKLHTIYKKCYSESIKEI